LNEHILWEAEHWNPVLIREAEHRYPVLIKK
jgi:hypothetical protein